MIVWWYTSSLFGLILEEVSCRIGFINRSQKLRIISSLHPKKTIPDLPKPHLGELHVQHDHQSVICVEHRRLDLVRSVYVLAVSQEQGGEPV